MPHPIVSLCPRPVRIGIPVAIVFGGMWLGHYMMADRPLPTVVAAAPTALSPIAGSLALPGSLPPPSA